ncbi:MAG TPA: MFS transporter [Gemmatimonadales bacterium]|nr:MFS transporter [Gemmatimonadales bacterium]
MHDPVHDPNAQFRRLSVLITVGFVDMLGLMMVLPLLPFYALNMHATDVQVGSIIAAFSIAQLISAPLWGKVSDRYGRRSALLVGLAASAVAFVVFGFATSLWMLFLSRFIQGAGGGTTGVAQAYVADTVRPADRARALGWLSSASQAGVILGPMIGLLAIKLGTQAPGLLAAGLCAINIFFAWHWLPESKAEIAPDAPQRRVWAPAWDVLRHPGRPVSQLIWIYGMGMFGFMAINSVLPLYLADRFAVNEHTYGYFLTYFGILSIVIRVVLLGPVVRRFGERGTVRLGCIALIFGFLLYPLPPSVWLLAALVMPLVPLGTALLFPSTTSLISGFTARQEIGVTMGVAQTFAGVARAIAPFLSTFAYQYIGHAWSFVFAAGLIGVVSVLAFRLQVSAPPTQTPVPV